MWMIVEEGGYLHLSLKVISAVFNFQCIHSNAQNIQICQLCVKSFAPFETSNIYLQLPTQQEIRQCCLY